MMRRFYLLLLLCCAASASKAGSYTFYYWGQGGLDTAIFTSADLAGVDVFPENANRDESVCGAPYHEGHHKISAFQLAVRTAAYIRRGAWCLVSYPVYKPSFGPTDFFLLGCSCIGYGGGRIAAKAVILDEEIVPQWYWNYPGEKSLVTDPETGAITGINVELPPDEPGKVAGENGDYVIGENGPEWEFYDGMNPGPTREAFDAGVDTIGGKLDVLHVDNTVAISELQSIESAINAIPPATVTVEPEIIVDPVINVEPPAVTVQPNINVEPVINVAPADVTVDFPSELQVDLGEGSYAGYGDLVDLGDWANLDADLYQTGVDTNFGSAAISPAIASADYNIVSGDGDSWISGLGDGVAGAVETLLAGVTAFLDPFRAIGKVESLTVIIYNKPMTIDFGPYMAVINVIRAIGVLAVYYLSFCSVRSAVFMIFGGA